MRLNEYLDGGADRAPDARTAVSDRAGNGHRPARADLAAWCWDRETGEVWWSPELHRLAGGVSQGLAPTLPATAALFGVEPEELLWRAQSRSAIRVHSIPGSGGARRLLEVRGWPGAGDPRYLFATCRDVTVPQGASAARRMAAQRDAILRATPDGVCGIDHAGRIAFVNPAFQRLVGREGEDLTGRRLHDIVHCDASQGELHDPRDCPYAPSARAQDGTDADFRRRDGSPVEIRYERLADDDQLGAAIVSLRDVTERHATARLLQSSLRQIQALDRQRAALLLALAAAEERERLRIAADIHDDTVQVLGAVALRLSNAGERVSGDAERNAFADAELEVRAAAERLRQLMFELMPPEEERDLRAAVRAHCSVVFASSKMSYELVGDAGPLAPERSLTVYRLIQEIVRNALKHSRGSRVRIELERHADAVVARVSDDGVGMRDRGAAPTHAGLRIVRRRAEAVGAEAVVGAGLEGRGTSVELRLTLDADGAL